MQRLTISLDDDLARALDELQEHAGDSKANLIRRALRAYVKRQRERGGERPTEFDLRVWTELLANREHVVLDLAHIRLLFTHSLGAPQEFWHELREIGVEHGRQYRDKGMRQPVDILQVMQAANWFLLSPESDRSWALIFTEPTAKPFVKAFLEGFYSELPVRVDVIEEKTKLRVRVASPSPLAHRGAASV